MILCATLFSPIQAQAAFNKTRAKKNVTVTYKKLPDGILAIYNNKNKTTIRLTASMNFQDGDKKSISKDTQTNLCLSGKSKAALLFPTPRDEYGNPVNYSSYKGSFSVAKSKYKSYSKKINIDNLEPGDLLFFSCNSSGRGNVGHVAIVAEVNKDNGTCKFIHASVKKGVTFQNFPDGGYYDRHFIGARRVLD